ncbi:TonB-dependent receptor, partial [Gemmatimonas sp.]|uniref:TonB-dependent receptor n=1 Tax=Gemmatimonas sp. TaxID=1962908 RepID=UPI0027B8D35F
MTGRFTRGWWFVNAILLCASRADAQSMAQGLSGVVHDNANRGIASATVEVRNTETGYLVRTSTTATGRYAVLGLPVGGPYTVRARRVGYEPSERTGITLTTGSRVQVDLTLGTSGTRLGTVNVSATQDSMRNDARNDGRNARMGGSTRITRAQLDALPVADRNLAELATLSPLAGPQLSLAGQRWTSTDIRFDGAQARNQLRAGELNGGPTAISLEAVREFEVNTALYDAALGRQGGGQLTAVTRSGTNLPEARLFVGFRNTSLAAPRDFAGRPRSAREAQTLQTAIAAGGPIVRDRAHWFAAYERYEVQDQLITGDVSTPTAENAAGISRDSLQRILGILATRYGVTDTGSQLGRLQRTPQAQTLFARVDWQLTPRNRSTLRLTISDWSNPLSGGVDQPIALREARSTFTSREAQLFAALTSQLGSDVTHEVQVTAGRGHRALTPESAALPRAFVQVRSLLPNGAVGTSTVQFGGNRLAPDDSHEWQWQLQQRVTASRGAWVLTAGQDHALTGARTYIAESQSGLFVFPSIDALAQARPDRFTRTVPLDRSSTESRQHVAELGMFTQAEWQPSLSVSVTAGLRWDATAFLDAPATDSTIDRLFATRTGRAPADWAQWQPRAQVVWRPRGDEHDVIRVGGGWFHAQLPYYLQHNQLLYTGRSLTDVDLRGARTPSPDFPGYRSGTTTIPGVPAGTTPGPAYVNVAGAVRAPRTTRASAAWVHRVDSRVTVTLGGQWSHARDGYHYIDQNLRQTPFFRLAEEGDRAVWVPATSITTSTGATDVRNASRVPEYARVLALESVGAARQWSLTAEASVTPRPWVTGTAAYAYSRATDNSSFGCCLARTATTFTPIRDDPRDLASAWGPADGDQRHRVVGT